MLEFDKEKSVLIGSHGSLKLPPDDKGSLKLAMLLLGECSEIGPIKAAQMFDYSKARYYQIRDAFSQKGVEALLDEKTGPKTNYRRTREVEKLVIRARCLDSEESTDVIKSKLVQDGYTISKRSVDRIINTYGLQKKTPSAVPAARTKNHRNATNQQRSKN
jgi:transposase